MELQKTLSDFKQYAQGRIESFFNKGEGTYPLNELPGFEHPALHHTLNHSETIILLTSIVPHLVPNFFDSIIQECLPAGGEFAEIGGVKGNNTRYMLPTGDTALFLLAGTDADKRKYVFKYLGPSHWFYTENILKLEDVKDGEPRMSGRLILQQEYLDLFTTGIISKPAFGPDFPAKLVTTKMEWSDLVVTSKTLQQLHDIKTWLLHHKTLMDDWGMDKKIKPGFKVLFYGPPGTGKTLTSTLLGKEFNKEVYRIDLSQIVSKYIGETEKNLEKVFQKAENKDWILFFDEADALFGKRSNVKDSHDRYANQEVSYLLQRVEDFPGLIILASNYKTNIDQAFMRRFNSIIHFAMPNQQERFDLWNKSLPAKAVYADDVDLLTISAKYELSGSAIINVIQFASLQAINSNTNILSKAFLLEGIKREYEKEERVFIA
jgi:hypothetical protein